MYSSLSPEARLSFTVIIWQLRTPLSYKAAFETTVNSEPYSGLLASEKREVSVKIALPSS